MSAVACLRILVDPSLTGLSEAVLAPLVGKIVSAYLETRWTWPRRFAPVAAYAFLLTDPHARQLDVRELARLSKELQIKLFGASAAGEVSLVLFEGTEAAARAFGALDRTELAAVLADPTRLPPGGRLSQITATAPDGPPPADPHDLSARAAPPEPGAPAEPTGRLHGVYFTLRGVFIGDVLSAAAPGARPASIVGGPEQMPRDAASFDAACITAALGFLADPGFTSLLYVPIAYDSVVRTSLRAQSEQDLSKLPADRRGQLAAVVYHAPRDPMFGAMSQIRATLGPRFTSIDLRVDDPGFEVEKLSPGAVAGVSFALPSGDRLTRFTALRQFAARRDLYRQRRIWASVTNVRDTEELAACAALRIPFVTGPAVSPPLTRPLGGLVLPLERLPAGAAAGAAAD